MSIEIYIDSATPNDISTLIQSPNVTGITTNPSLYRQAGAHDYDLHTQELLSCINGKSISIEVLSNDPAEMALEAKQIASWGKNIYVKIPIVNIHNQNTTELISILSNAGIPLNITTIFTFEQAQMAIKALSSTTPALLSIFAGRLADGGHDPVPLIQACVAMKQQKPNTKLLWASTRERYNILQAEQLGCDIITAPPSIVQKTQQPTIDPNTLSLLAVQQFNEDAQAAALSLPLDSSVNP